MGVPKGPLSSSAAMGNSVYVNAIISRNIVANALRSPGYCEILTR